MHVFKYIKNNKNGFFGLATYKQALQNYTSILVALDPNCERSANPKNIEYEINVTFYGIKCT